MTERIKRPSLIAFDRGLELLDHLTHFILGFTEFLLKPPQEFILFALRKSKVVIGKVSEFLFKLTFQLIPRTFRLKRAHMTHSLGSRNHFTDFNQSCSEIALLFSLCIRSDPLSMCQIETVLLTLAQVLVQNLPRTTVSPEQPQTKLTHRYCGTRCAILVLNIPRNEANLSGNPLAAAKTRALRIACSIVSIRRYVANRLDASSRASVVFPVPGRPLNTISITHSFCPDASHQCELPRDRNAEFCTDRMNIFKIVLVGLVLCVEFHNPLRRDATYGVPLSTKLSSATS
jgi:hypothetical protein